MPDPRTIVAISSTVGNAAARIILRLSGPGAPPIASTLCPDGLFSPARATRTKIAVGGYDVPCWLYAFRAPHSYTGEDLVELHLPGNEFLARLLLSRILELGARPADPGEFTARAYFNGRMELTAAEGVAAAVSASNDDELRAARQLMAGQLATRLRPLMDRLAETLGLVEVGIDFSDQDVTFLPPEEVARRAQEIDASLADLISQSDRLERLSAEPTVVLVGRPNAGKSTLLNALAGHDRAVVSPVAGTTRDLLSADVPLLRGLIRLTDAAGLDDTPATHTFPLPPSPGTPGEGRGEGLLHPSSFIPHPSPAHAHIESEMRRRALDAVRSADLVLLAVAADDPRPRLDVGRCVDLVVLTKSDLAPTPPGALAVCAPTGDGLPRLRETLDDLAFGGRSTASHRLALNRRHLQHLDAARSALQRAEHAPASELAALELRDALDSLGAILGVISPDDVLGLVFSRFCIGK